MKICHEGAKIGKKMCSFEVSIGLLALIVIVSSKNPYYRSVMKIHQHGAKIFHKKGSFAVSIELLPLVLMILGTEPLFSITHCNCFILFCRTINAYFSDNYFF